MISESDATKLRAGVSVKKSRTNTPLVFGGLAVVLLGAAGAWIALSPKAAQPVVVTATPPAIPAGRLQLLRTGVAESRLLAVDQIKPEGGLARVTVLVMSKSARGLENQAAVRTEDKVLDCADGRVFDDKIGFFDFDKVLLKTERLAAGKRGRVAGADELEMGPACGKPLAEALPAFKDFDAAQRELQSPPDDYETLAASKRPNDPHAAAWLCGAGARGRWRNTTAADCERAATLNPDDTALQVDRAFFLLMGGKQQQADQALKNVLARDPNVAPAQFGRGLIAALRGDMAVSKAFRDKGFALDPDVPNGIERRYNLRIDDRFRKP